jgi:hypothetical protein
MAMKPVEGLGLVAMLVMLIAPWFIVGLPIWGWLFVVVGVAVGAFEIYSIIKNDKTISQIFWEFRDKHKWSAYGVLIGATVGWGLLIWHLLS